MTGLDWSPTTPQLVDEKELGILVIATIPTLKRPQACNFIKKETLAQVFSCEFCEISKNIFFLRTPLVAASYDTCVLNKNFNSYQVKCIKELQNVKDAFLKKLSDTEQNLERNFKEKEYAGASPPGGLDFVVTRRSGIFWQNFFY